MLASYFLAAFGSQKDDFFFRSPFGETAGQGKGLKHRQFFDQRILAGVLNFTQNIDFLTSWIEYRYGDERTVNKFF